MRKRELAPRPGIDPRADQLAERLRALADPIRLRLLGLLAHGDCPVGALATALGVGQPLVSFHLDQLATAGLIRLERAGRFTYAQLRHPAAQTLLDEVGGLLGVDGPTAAAAGPARSVVPDDVLSELYARFGRLLTTERVERVTTEEATRLGHLDPAQAPPVVSVHAAQRLRALAQAERRIAKAVPEVLFVCVHNAARSQMAAALAATLGGGHIHAWSAGSQPAVRLHPEAVAVMAEIGIDLAGQVPKPWTTELVRAADVVVTMGCGEDIPVFPGVRYLAWQIPDPAGQPLTAVRGIRDQLAAHVRALLDDLAPSGSTPSDVRPRPVSSPR
jgi:arsenate reductase (thioredoxin)